MRVPIERQGLSFIFKEVYMKKQTRITISENIEQIDMYIRMISKKLEDIYPPPATNHVDLIKKHLERMGECTDNIMHQVYGEV